MVLGGLVTPKMAYTAIKYAPYAYRAGKKVFNTVQAANRQYRQRIAVQRIRAQRAKGFGGPSVGVYQGKFKRPKRAKTTKIADYLSTGAMNYKEVYGDINDPECVYLTFSTWDRYSLLRTIHNALFKKLLKKAGINMDSATAELPLTNYNDSSGVTIVAVYKNPNDDNVVATYSIPNDTSLQSLYDNDACSLRTWMINKLEGNAETTQSKLERIIMKVGAGGVVLAELNVMQEVLQCESILSIAIQNRTKGAGDTTSASTERVDSQPIVGKLYEFVGGVPNEKQYGGSPIRWVDTSNGIGLFQAGGDINYQEPPPARHFSNVTKCSSVMLNPSIIKRHTMKWYARGYLNNLFDKWKNITNRTINANIANIGAVMANAPGKCAMFAFEEVLNSGSSNKITVSYELDRKDGAKLITAKPAPMKPYRTVVNFSKTS